ncbi:hypothetical protein WI41_17040 [Burkholderia latens]|uniref:Uncharacterized protein n=1 Tax=Burkholderia latens TaxID=488446 RepID=A0AAP1G9B2_9BURK|nr:hypothetical protein [Burkholderia latens]AIO41811.1 hypothetical protein DM40_2726 [Burkholderia cenocepacia]MBR7958982.1 hypothetical protein [Burkholderia vietnamiensis]AOK04778.1 hypothetical protein WK25_10080 [Burkholderia latens]KVA06249.1 hypothetical protein WI41_17040 [Burkholderia latens]QTO42479.1 hypothetical protein J8I85_10385 [Burkholderia latens]
MMKRLPPSGRPEREVLFFSRESLQAPVPSLPEWSGVPPRVARFPSPDDRLATCARDGRRRGHAGRSPFQHRHGFVATVSDYSCYG